MDDLAKKLLDIWYSDYTEEEIEYEMKIMQEQLEEKNK
jgi:hypothetical protein